MAAHAHAKVLEARNDTWSHNDRMIFATELRSMQRTAVESLNVRFDDKFLFGGSSTKQLPFELDDGPPQVLRFRGIDVTTDDPFEQERLREFAGEKIFVDIGLGLSFDGRNLRENSAFNVAVPGISFLGFGPNRTDNFILNMGELARVIEEEPFSHDRTGELALKLQEQHQDLLLAVTRVGADHNFLRIRLSVLENNSDDLNAKILNVEFDDMERLIMSWKMTEYVYRASLEMGARILQPSFIDFMR
jgi:flagellar hook-associated protein 3 FlgL